MKLELDVNESLIKELGEKKIREILKNSLGEEVYILEHGYKCSECQGYKNHECKTFSDCGYIEGNVKSFCIGFEKKK